MHSPPINESLDGQKQLKCAELDDSCVAPYSYSSAQIKLQYFSTPTPLPRFCANTQTSKHSPTEMDSSTAFVALIPCIPSISASGHAIGRKRKDVTLVQPANMNMAENSKSVVTGETLKSRQSKTERQPGRDFHGIPNPPPGSRLTLPDLRERLIRQEETIIFALIERAQFRVNDIIYQPGAFDLPKYPKQPQHAGSGDEENVDENQYDLSFSQYMLYELEKVSARVRRYTSPDEHPFAPRHILPNPTLPALDYPPTLAPNSINVNDTVAAVYQNSIIPSICEAGDDQNYGSSATCDAACLQALSKRIHYGKFIAEAKCQADEATYRKLALSNAKQAIWDLLSDLSVEKLLLKRVENKARNYGSDITVDGPRDVFKVEPKIIGQLYEDFIIPLTKDVEVQYILQRYTTKNAS